MDAEELNKWKKAGKLASEALLFGKDLIRINQSMLKVTENIEEYVIKNFHDWLKNEMGEKA